ncbi:MAG TPA: glycerophosphodiester phosphodiesterase family protein [Desulfomonilia bacterium]
MIRNSTRISKNGTILKGIILISSFFSLIISNNTASANNEMTIFEKTEIPEKAVIAHRGASWFGPEETEPAYILARELGADYLEFDIQLTSDGVPVLFHDDTLLRTTNVADVFPQRKNAAISAFTLAELKSLDAGSWFNLKNPDRARPSYKNLRILTLEEVIKIASSGRPGQRLYIESKSPEAYPGIEEKIVSQLKSAGWLDKSKVVFQSFSLESLKRFKELAPEISRVYLVDEKLKKDYGWNKLVKDSADNATGIGPSGYIAWPWNISKAHKRGLIVHVYTINALWQAKLINLFGADGIFTDRCDMLLKHYGRDNKTDPNDILKKYGY